GIFEAMAGLPVTIRLLDPPLHEFLPPLEEAKDERMRERIRALQESNPMLGTRGCRLGLLWPEIYEMQVRAIIRAAPAVEERGRAAKEDLKMGICGEHGGEPESIAFCHRLGLEYVSCSPYRVPLARLAAAQGALREAGVESVSAGG